MHVMFRLSPLMGVVLLGAAQVACAESPLPDPIAPAVIGRPLDQIRPARPVRHKPAVPKPDVHKQVATSSKAVRSPAPIALAPAAVQQAPVPPPTHVAGNAGSSTQLASNPPGPGGYFSSRDLELVRNYYVMHPVSAQPANWKIGEPIPPRAELTGVPDDLRAALSPLRPGQQYVQVDGDVVLVAVQSRVVVDGISRGGR